MIKCQFRIERTFLAAFVNLIIVSCAMAQGYSVTFLNSLTVGGSNKVFAINNSGQMVGFSDAPGGASHAVIWAGSAHLVSDLGTLGGFTSVAYAINNNGVVAGSASLSNGVSHGAIWANSTIKDLNSNIDNGPEKVYGINNSIQSVGQSPSGFGQVAVRWDSAGSRSIMPALPNGRGGTSAAYGINDAGLAVGVLPDANFFSRAVLWNGQAVTDLGALPGAANSEARAINNLGQIVGSSDSFAATLWSGGTIVNLGSLAGRGSAAASINNLGVIVGDSLTSSGVDHATLYKNGMVIDLNLYLNQTLVAAGWVLSESTGINDDGWIVGNAFNNKTGIGVGFLLSPVPELATNLLYCFGLLVLFFVFRAVRNETIAVDQYP